MHQYFCFLINLKAVRGKAGLLCILNIARLWKGEKKKKTLCKKVIKILSKLVSIKAVIEFLKPWPILNTEL